MVEKNIELLPWELFIDLASLSFYFGGWLSKCTELPGVCEGVVPRES